MEERKYRLHGSHAIIRDITPENAQNPMGYSSIILETSKKNESSVQQEDEEHQQR